MLITGEPGKNEFINPLLNYLGVEQLPGQIATDDPDVNHHFVYGNVDIYFGDLLERTSKKIFMPSAAALNVKEDKSYKYTTLIASDEQKTWLDDKITGNSGTPTPFLEETQG